METLQLGDTGYPVESLQKKLKKILNADLAVDGIFGYETENHLEIFQKFADLQVDGIAGPRSWNSLLKQAYDFDGKDLQYLKIVEDAPLPAGEYVPELFDKRTIYLHHTAGHSNPYNTRHWWEIDKKVLGKSQYRVGTAFIIGRRADDGGQDFDGHTLRVFEEKYWAHHLGLRYASNRKLNAESIGIEICNLGPLERVGSNFYKVWRDVGGRVTKSVKIPIEEVCDLGYRWRGHQYFQHYTEKQLLACKRLILGLARVYQIPIRKFAYSPAWFDIKLQALSGQPGLWTHVNVRTDKTDCYPHPGLIEMLNELYDAYSSNYETPSPSRQTTETNKEKLKYYYEH